ncbi:MAG: M66 family metalloprotease [Paucimonas sp.]|jgi:hypothetical protein|nr:M66 family metalloprotease [Paucimonas sp.]
MSAANTIAFNDQPLKDDLHGSLQGSVLCAQTNILPSRASKLPEDVHVRLVAQRATLVMFKPLAGEVLPYVELQVIAADGALLYSAPMDPPSALPAVADGGVTSAGKQIVYGDNFWTYRLPWSCILPGIRFLFGSGFRSGYYHDVSVGAPGELMLHVIDVGMLTEPQDMFTSTFDADLQRQLFQQLPCSQLVVNRYEPVHWKEIMMPDGTLYKERSTKGEAASAHTGDIRQRIGKELVLLGINNANVGIHSSPGIGEGGLSKHHVASQIAVHSSVGLYTEGRVVHGSSGGGSIVTAKGCKGDDFYQYVVRALSLDGATASFKNSVHRPAGSPNSTWGWDSDKNVFLPNFAKKETGEVRSMDNECQAPFHGHRFGIDTLAGGWELYPAANAYPLLTPYTLDKVQSAIQGKVVYDEASKTGYSVWNEKTRSMEPWAEFTSLHGSQAPVEESTLRALLMEHRVVEVSIWNSHWAKYVYVPAASAENKGRGLHIVHEAMYGSELHINGEVVKLVEGNVLNYESNGSKWVQVDDFSFNFARKPMWIGTAVTTILGYYDPDAILPAWLYSPLHADYCNVFRWDRGVELKRAKCRIEVRAADGDMWGYVLSSKRLDAGVMNRVHVNIPRSIKPVTAELFVDGRRTVLLDLTKPTGKSRASFHGRK